MAETGHYCTLEGQAMKGGYHDSIDAVLPELIDTPEEYIIYLTDAEKEAMLLNLIGCGLVKPGP